MSEATATPTVIPETLRATLTEMGRLERVSLGVVQSNMPPKLVAAEAMADAASRGELKPSDALACLAIYNGNAPMPSSAKVQASKFAQFIKAGAAGIGVQTIIAVQDYFKSADDKTRAKFGGAGTSLGSAFETTLKVVRGALTLGHVPSHTEIATILAPTSEPKDTGLSLLESAKKFLDSAAGECPTLRQDVADLAKHVAELIARQTAFVAGKPVVPPAALDADADRNTREAIKAVTETRKEAGPVELNDILLAA